ncbi:malonic semialdehyde reductase [Croceicoccus estronivorus]|uniref:malonic semialdehyde reductase n=1 Tax=Croceicoccus estronivorus TaxID=1172626 RepID=UPI00082B8DC5|nr:malonic semialdehyde reductase [Croceicoccus estronivorus]OCC22754.1 malonic semialdehyde reductase [Croceicoccus estronivorus]
MTTEAIPDSALDQLFRTARSFNGWLDQDVSDADIHRIYELLKMGPTAANMQPSRFVWCRSPEAKARLAAHASQGNQSKILTAPVCVVIGMDQDFHEELPWLFPHTDAKSWYAGDAEGRTRHALRNSSLQGAYLMLAARAIGLDCGPMSGFDEEGVTQEFFADQAKVKANFICSIGYGDKDSIFARSPRPEFDTFNTIL